MVLSPRLCIVLAVVLWSLSGTFGKLIDLPGPTIAFYRALFASFFLLFFVRKKKIIWDPRIALCALFFFGMNVSYISSLRLTSAANAIFLQYTAPIWVLIGSYFFLGEKSSFLVKVGVFTATIGVAYILMSVNSGDSLNGCILAAVAGFCFGAVSLLFRALRSIDGFFLTFVIHFFAAICLLPLLIAFPEYGSLAIERHHFLLLAAFGILQMAIPYVLFSKGLKEIPASEAAIICYAEPVLNPIFAFLFAGDKPNLQTITGGAIILSGLIISRVNPRTISFRSFRKP